MFYFIGNTTHSFHSFRQNINLHDGKLSREVAVIDAINADEKGKLSESTGHWELSKGYSL